MIIALHNNDKTRFPNLALMKLSAWHKQRGDNVEWYMPLFADRYDLIYSSKVFTFTKNDTSLPERTIKGGTGYGLYESLKDEIEHIMPDYSLYPDVDYGLGFTTRGCIRKCPWCIVPKKEGTIYPNTSIESLIKPDSNKVVLMDNNILAHAHGLEQLEKSIQLGLRIDCNQGLDARLIANNKDIAKLLARVKWIQTIRLACDNKEQIPYVEKAVRLIRHYGKKQFCFMSYVLVNDIPDALERVEFLRALKVDPFAQPYRDFTNNNEPSRELRMFSRWVNHKAIFKTVRWEDYNKKSRYTGSKKDLGISLVPISAEGMSTY